MKPTVKQLLSEMVNYTDPKLEEKILKNATSKMEFSDIYTLIKSLLQWPKMIVHFPNLLEKYTKDYMIIEDVLFKRFTNFFNLCSDLNEIFELKEDKIVFNSKLSEKEKEEIINFIDKNHTLTVQKVRGRNRNN